AEELLQGKQAGQQGGDPDHARCDAGQQIGPGSDAQGYEDDDRKQKDQRQQRFTAVADGQTQVAPEQGVDGRIHHASCTWRCTTSTSGGRARSGWRWWVDRIAAPSRPSWSASRASTRLQPSSSRLA